MSSRPTRFRAPGAPGAAGAVTGPSRDGYAPVFWTAFRRSSNPMVLLDLERRIVAVNAPAAELAARPVTALIGLEFMTLLDDPAEALEDREWRARLAAGESFGHRRIRRADGTIRLVDFAMRAATVDDHAFVLGVCLHAHADREANDVHAPAPLTAREREIVHLVALGRVSREICDELHVAPDTVRTHVRNAMAKTGARTRAQLIAIAMGDGLLDG